MEKENKSAWRRRLQVTSTGSDVSSSVAEVKENPNWKEKVITGDETCVYRYDLETKRQSMEWKGKDEPKTKKFRLCKSKNKVLLVTFFDIKGIVHYEYLENGQTINKESYLNIMRRVRESIRLKRSEMWRKRFDTRKSIIADSKKVLKNIPKDAFFKCFKSWEKRWKLCIDAGGE
ncbi:CLCN3 [Cordylochernes scorpioides]|uniref:CLCN3 n=1 Tax=Cordylochernes scorpioides TaxID=51811 RepID=A0ABY6KX55_9ARAC|nr:CLCN3 [Cordylochernes scorpioides]